jgi:hypothetical protein
MIATSTEDAMAVSHLDQSNSKTDSERAIYERSTGDFYCPSLNILEGSGQHPFPHQRKSGEDSSLQFSD